MKITLFLQNQEVIDVLKKLKRGKTLFIECAIRHFLQTENGQFLLESLLSREKEKNKNKQSSKAASTIDIDKFSR